MKTAWVIVLIILLLSIAGNVYQWNSHTSAELKASLDNQLLRTRLAQNAAVAQSARDSVRLIRSERGIRDSIHRVSVNRLEIENRQKDRRIAELRKPVATLIDSVAPLKAFVAVMDSSLQVKDSLNNMLNAHLQIVEKSFNAELFQKDTELIAEKAISTDWKDAAETSESNYQKLKKKRFSVGVSGGYSVVSTGGEIRTGPAIQVGIVYNLFRF